MRPFLPLAILALLAAHASADFKDGVFTSAEHGARFKLPKDWKVEDGKGDKGKVVTFQSADGEIKGAFRHVKEGMGASKHAKWRSVEWEKKGASVTWDSEEKPKGREGDWLEVKLSFEAGPDEYKSAHLYFSKDKDDYEFAVMVKADKWSDSEKTIADILASVEYGEFKEEAGGSEKEVVMPSPWDGCAKGSWVKLREVMETAGEKKESVITITLLDSDETSFTQKKEVTIGDVKQELPPEKIKLLHKVRDAGGDVSVSEEGDEAITCPKGEFKCHWVKTTWQEGWSKTWTCAEVPGRIVRVTSELIGTKSQTELVDFEKK